MFAAYHAVTLLAAAVNGVAAVANLIGREYPEAQADRLDLPRSWLLPLGTLLAAGALGLLVGLAVPVVGTLAAGGLVLYFLGAFGAHLRVRDHQLGPLDHLLLPGCSRPRRDCGLPPWLKGSVFRSHISGWRAGVWIQNNGYGPSP